MTLLGGWSALHERAGMADFWRVYEAHLGDLDELTWEAAREDPQFGPVVASLAAEDLAARRVEGRERLAAGMNSGDWDAYLADLDLQGATYAHLDVGYSAWFRLVRVVGAFLVPRLVATYSEDTARLSAALDAMQTFFDAAMARIGETYLATQKALLAEREEDLATTRDSIGDAVIATDVEGRVV